MVIKLLSKVWHWKYLAIFCLYVNILIYIYVSYTLYKVCNVEGIDVLADFAVNVTVSNQTYYSHEVKNLCPVWVFPLLFIKPMMLGFVMGCIYTYKK